LFPISVHLPHNPPTIGAHTHTHTHTFPFLSAKSKNFVTEVFDREEFYDDREGIANNLQLPAAIFVNPN